MVVSTALLISGIIASLLGVGSSIGGIVANSVEAQKQRDFEKEMSNTAIQRQVKDAQAAGISPALVLGNGASTPMGATANVNTSGIEHSIANTANNMLDYIKQDRALDAAQQMKTEELQTKQIMQNERLEHKVQMLQMRNTAKHEPNFIHHNFTKEELNNLYDDLDKVKLT